MILPDTKSQAFETRMFEGKTGSSSERMMTRNANAMRGAVNQYLRWNLSVFPIGKNKRILDLGCGPGIYFSEVMRYAPSFYVGADSSPDFLGQLAAQFGDRKSCRTVRLNVMTGEGTEALDRYTFEYIFFFDVLEHLDDEGLALANIRSIMKKCRVDYLFLRVPALPVLYGANDAAIGHCRRYTKASLHRVLDRARFQIKSLHYQNFAGIFSWYFIGRILKRDLAVSSTEGKLFNQMVPFFRILENIVPPPWGSTLACICTLKETDP